MLEIYYYYENIEIMVETCTSTHCELSDAIERAEGTIAVHGLDHAVITDNCGRTHRVDPRGA